MKIKFTLAVLTTFASSALAHLEDLAGSSPSSRSGIEDQSSAESGFGGGGGGIENSKYFQYQHLPEHDKYEFGFRRGNDHHVKERYEKAVPHDGHFKTKVRWADHKGGHGEHYWDYNHAGHHDDGDGEGSELIPSYTTSQDVDRNYMARNRQTAEDLNVNRRAYPAVDQKGDHGIRTFQDEISQVQGFEVAREEGKTPQQTPEVFKRKGSKGLTISESLGPSPRLYFDMKNGKVVDEATGKTYFLQEFSN